MSHPLRWRRFTAAAFRDFQILGLAALGAFASTFFPGPVVAGGRACQCDDHLSRLSASEIPVALRASQPMPEAIAGIKVGERPITALAFARDGAQLIVAEAGPPQRDAGPPGRLLCYDLTGEAPRELKQSLPQATQDAFGSLAVLADDEEDWLVAGGIRWDQSLKLWRRTAGDWQQAQSIPDFSPWWHRSLQFSPEGSVLATVSGDSAGPVRLWHLNRQQQKLEPRAVLEGADWGASALAFSHDGSFLAAGLGSGHRAEKDGRVLVWDLSGSPHRPIADVSVNAVPEESAPRDVTALAWLDGDDALVGGDQSGELCTWRKNKDGTLALEWRKQAHAGSVRSIIPLADRRFLTSGDDGRIKLWSNGGEQRHEWRFGNAGSIVLAGAISGRHFAAGLGDGRVYILKMRSANSD